MSTRKPTNVTSVTKVDHSLQMLFALVKVEHYQLDARAMHYGHHDDLANRSYSRKIHFRSRDRSFSSKEFVRRALCLLINPDYLQAAPKLPNYPGLTREEGYLALKGAIMLLLCHDLYEIYSHDGNTTVQLHSEKGSLSISFVEETFVNFIDFALGIKKEHLSLSKTARAKLASFQQRLRMAPEEHTFTIESAIPKLVDEQDVKEEEKASAPVEKGTQNDEK